MGGNGLIVSFGEVMPICRRSPLRAHPLTSSMANVLVLDPVKIHCLDFSEDAALPVRPCTFT